MGPGRYLGQRGGALCRVHGFPTTLLYIWSWWRMVLNANWGWKMKKCVVCTNHETKQSLAWWMLTFPSSQSDVSSHPLSSACFQFLFRDHTSNWEEIGGGDVTRGTVSWDSRGLQTCGCWPQWELVGFGGLVNPDNDPSIPQHLHQIGPWVLGQKVHFGYRSVTSKLHGIV